MASIGLNSRVQVADDYALEHLRGAVGIAQQIRVDDGAAWVVFDAPVRSADTANFIRAACIPSECLVPYIEEPDALPQQVQAALPAEVNSVICNFTELMPGVAWSNELMEELYRHICDQGAWDPTVQVEGFAKVKLLLTRTSMRRLPPL